MSELIVASPAVLDFRHQIMIFDRIACDIDRDDLSILISADPRKQTSWRSRTRNEGPSQPYIELLPLHPSPEEAEDYAFLKDRGVIFHPTIDYGDAFRRPRDDYAWELADSLYHAYKTKESSKMQSAWEAWLFYRSRKYAEELRTHCHLNVVPLITEWDNANPPFETSRVNVLKVVLEQVPTFTGSRHSLQDVIDFRDEMRAEGLQLSLRVWMNDIAAGKLTQIEIADKLEDLMARYERRLKLEKMQRESTVVESLVVTTAEIAESLIKFKWSILAKKLFQVRHEKIDLMKTEMTLPGREVAYIVHAKNRFRTLRGGIQTEH